jgi:hypothetical protein
MRRPIILTVSLFLVALTAQAQVTLTPSELSNQLLVWEHSGVGVSWWQVCRPAPTTCDVVKAVQSTTIAPITAGLKVWTAPMPTTLPAGQTTQVVSRACNDAGCDAAGTPIAVTVPLSSPGPPVNLRIVPLTPPPSVRQGTYIDSVVGLALRPDSIYRGAGLNGTDIGANVEAVMVATCGVIEGVQCSEVLSPKQEIERRILARRASLISVEARR